MKTKVLILLLVVTPSMLRAQINYAVSGSTAYVAATTNVSGNITIASTYNGFPVTSVSDSAFESCTNLTGVSIPGSVTSIGNNSFNYCTNLTNVIIPNTVTNIGIGAFAYCYNLLSATIGSGVTNIGNNAFTYCYALTNIAVTNANTAFSSLSGVLFNKNQNTLVVYPDGLPNANYVIPSGVTNITPHAFDSCTSLTNVTVPGSMTTIGLNAFANCSSLRGVSIPGTTTNIGDDAFYYCTSLTNVTFPNGVKSIGYGTLAGCYSLRSFVIPASVTSISNYAFYFCINLGSVTIPGGVTNIGDYAFFSCTSLGNLVFLGNPPALGGGSVFSGVYSKAYYYYGATGWGTTYGYLTTFMLGAPTPRISGTNGLGLQSGKFGFTLGGVTGQTIIIDASTNFVNWQPVWTNTLSGTSTNYTDALWTNYPRRYYRAH